MRIERRGDDTKMFDQLRIGEVFCSVNCEDDTKYYIKVETVKDATGSIIQNAVNLENGKHYFVNCDEIVGVPVYRFAVR